MGGVGGVGLGSGTEEDDATTMSLFEMEHGLLRRGGGGEAEGDAGQKGEGLAFHWGEVLAWNPLMTFALSGPFFSCPRPHVLRRVCDLGKHLGEWRLGWTNGSMIGAVLFALVVFASYCCLVFYCFGDYSYFSVSA